MYENKTEPLYIASQSTQQVDDTFVTQLVVLKWPNITQAVERGIQVITEACSEVRGYKAKDGYIR